MIVNTRTNHIIMSKKTDYKLKNEAFLVDKKQQEGVHELPKGVLYEIQKSGNPQGRQIGRAHV